MLRPQTLAIDSSVGLTLSGRYDGPLAKQVRRGGIFVLIAIFWSHCWDMGPGGMVPSFLV